MSTLGALKQDLYQYILVLCCNRNNIYNEYYYFSKRGVYLSLIDSNDIVCVEETAVTVRSYRRRTTVPSKIYNLLEIKPGDSLRWIALKDGTVYITKVKKESDPDE